MKNPRKRKKINFLSETENKNRYLTQVPAFFMIIKMQIEDLFLQHFPGKTHIPVLVCEPDDIQTFT